MILETWRVKGGGDATQPFFLPRREFAYRLLGLTVRATTDDAVAHDVVPNLQMLDGEGLPVFAVQFDMSAALVVSGNIMLATFAPLAPTLGSGAVLQPFDGFTTIVCGIPNEFWVLPQNQLVVRLGGATAGGSGVGDSIIDFALSVARI